MGEVPLDQLPKMMLLFKHWAQNLNEVFVPGEGTSVGSFAFAFITLLRRHMPDRGTQAALRPPLPLLLPAFIFFSTGYLMSTV